MQLAPIALACFLSAGVIAVAAEPAPAPPAEPTLALPDLAPTPAQPAKSDKPDTTEKPDKPVAVPARSPDATKSRAETARRPDPPHGRQCFNAADTREKIAAHRLADPFRALRSGRFQGEALRTRLCRWKSDDFVYEISVLRRDGRIVHVYMNAQTGQAVGALNDGDRK